MVLDHTSAVPASAQHWTQHRLLLNKHMHHGVQAVRTLVQIFLSKGRGADIHRVSTIYTLYAISHQQIISNVCSCCLLLDLLSQCARCEQLGYEVDREVLLIQPGVVERHDVLVLQLLEDPDLGKQTLTFCWGVCKVIHFDLIPCNLDALSLIKGLENSFERSSSKHNIILHYSVWGE